MDRQPREITGTHGNPTLWIWTEKNTENPNLWTKTTGIFYAGGGGSASLQPPRSLGYPGPKTLLRPPPSWENPGYGPA